MPGRITELSESQIVADLLADRRRQAAATTSVQMPQPAKDTFTVAATPATTYTLNAIPYQGSGGSSLNLSLNGLELVEGVDYTVDYTTAIVTVTATLKGTPTPADVLTADYWTTGDLIAASSLADTGGTTDTFNRADNVSLGTTSDGTATWTQQHGFGGTIGIVGNKARLPAATTGERFATVPAATSGSVQVDVPDSTNSNRMAGLTFRYIDSTHFFFAFVNGTQLSVNDQAGSYYVGTGAAGDTIRVDYTPTGFAVFRNGTSVFSITNAFYNTATAAGIYVHNSDGIGGGSVDNFSWVPA